MNRAKRRVLAAYTRATADEWHPFERKREAEVDPRALRLGNVVSMWANNRYSVQVYRRHPLDAPDHLHLAIRRQDDGTEYPWQDLQRIKNEIVGPDAVGLEVFPKQDEVVDLANMRHLFILPKGSDSPFTIKGRWD